MQCHSAVKVILITLTLFSIYETSTASPAVQRNTRQSKEPINAGEAQTDVKHFNALNGNQPQILPSFVGPTPYGGHYGGLAFSGSGYPAIPGLALLGMQFGNGASSSSPGFNTLQMGTPASLGFPAMGSYVGNNLPPYQLNGHEVHANPLFNGVTSLHNLVNMANMQGATGSESQTALLGAQVQQAQMQLQAQASQPQPQLVAGYPFTTIFYGPLNGYGPGFQGYQLI